MAFLIFSAARLKVQKDKTIKNYFKKMITNVDEEADGHRCNKYKIGEEEDDEVKKFSDSMNENREKSSDPVTFATNLNLVNQLLIGMTSLLDRNLEEYN